MAWRMHLLWVFLALSSAIFLQKVVDIVDEPYLDEVFHVGQAQAYCKRQWHIWDQKITTPPGLYIVSFLTHVFWRAHCSVTFLRALNVVVNCIAIPVVIRGIQRLLREQGKRERPTSRGQTEALKSYSDHTSLNIALFPVLFFFSALYYTDVISTLSVLVGYWVFLFFDPQHARLPSRSMPSASSNLRPQSLLLQKLAIILVGLISLSFRQTNIFWVSIYLGGNELVRTIKGVRGRALSSPNREATLKSIVQEAWNGDGVYNPPAAEANLTDYCKTVVSLTIAALANLKICLVAILPYLSLLGIFAAFVLWNGGVVLGDKSNHVATLHLSQILYIWPYILFFSLSLLCGNLLGPFMSRSLDASFLGHPIGYAATAILMLSVVHFNTIVHPFTLADNRHYVFYVFRWILLRHPLAKYLAVPIYLLCSRAVLSALEGSSSAPLPQTKPATSEPRILSDKRSIDTTRVSFILIWFLSTTLSLITAPLVEPRYFILPWLFWRLHLPLPRMENQQPRRRKPKGKSDWLLLFNAINALWLETIWFVLINLITCYVFLYRGFTWPQEPGRVQRFMW